MKMRYHNGLSYRLKKGTDHHSTDYYIVLIDVMEYSLPVGYVWTGEDGLYSRFFAEDLPDIPAFQGCSETFSGKHKAARDLIDRLKEWS